MSVRVYPCVGSYDGQRTKSSMATDETTLGPWSVAAYHKGSLADYANSSGKPCMELVCGYTYSIFAIANTPSSEDFFLDYSREADLYEGLEVLSLGQLHSGLLPMSCEMTCHVTEESASIPIVFKRLVAKYDIRVDCDFDDPEASFTVTGLSVMNSPFTFRPFQYSSGRFGIAALSLSEVQDGMDCASPSDIDLLNSGSAISLYTLENLQGTIVNDDSWLKTTDSPATWIELTGDWTTAGASASMTYRMYLGSNATSDFNIERNTAYNLTLSLSEAGFGHLESSWKISRADFSDNRTAHVEGDLYSDRIMVYDDGQPSQYIIDKNIEGIDFTVRIEEMEGACLDLVRTGDVIEITTALRDCLSRPCDELVVSTRDGVELRRVPVTVFHRLNFFDYALGGEATDPEDVTVGQKLIFSIRDIDVFDSEGYPGENLGYRFGRYSDEQILSSHCFDVQRVTTGPGEVVLECWAMDDPGDFLYLEIYDRLTGEALTRDGVFLVRRPVIRWVDWVGAGGWQRTQAALPQPLYPGGESRALLLQYLSSSGYKVEFNQELLQELDLEPNLSSSNNGYLSIDPVFTTSFGDVNYPRQVYRVSIENPHDTPRTVGSFISQYYSGFTEEGFRMPPLTATCPNACEAALLPEELRLRPIDISVSWSGNNLAFSLDYSNSAELKIKEVTQNSALTFSVQDALARLAPGVLTREEMFEEAVSYTLDYKLRDPGYIVSNGVSVSDSNSYEYLYRSSSTILGETVTGQCGLNYNFPVKGTGSDGANLWLDNSTMLQTVMSFPMHRIDIGFKTSFPELFLPVSESDRVPFNIVSCPANVTLTLDGKPAGP